MNHTISDQIPTESVSATKEHVIELPFSGCHESRLSLGYVTELAEEGDFSLRLNRMKNQPEQL